MLVKMNVLIVLSFLLVSSSWANLPSETPPLSPLIDVPATEPGSNPKDLKKDLPCEALPERTLENLPPTDTIHQVRVRKCQRIISTFYNYRGRANFGPHIEYFISYHEKLEREHVAKGDMRAKGFGETWWWSLVYGGANFSMTCYGVAPGNCAGPLDVKHYPLVLDPKANIRHHTNEIFTYYRQNGVRGIDLCRWVMYPARPHDWGGGMFAKTNRKHLNDIARAYRFGKL